MSDGNDNKPLNMVERQTTIEEFSSFCIDEKERILNSGDDMNENDIDEAIELTVRKLQVLADEGWS